jgi:hypothetical protein
MLFMAAAAAAAAATKAFERVSESEQAFFLGFVNKINLSSVDFPVFGDKLMWRERKEVVL